MIELHPLGETSRRVCSEKVLAYAEARWLSSGTEGCGYAVLARDLPDTVTFTAEVENVSRHPDREFNFGVRDVLRVGALEEQGHRVAIWHSHPTMSARPSSEDVRLMALADHRIWLIASIQEKRVTAWSVAAGYLQQVRWTALPPEPERIFPGPRRHDE